jgi:hypothetical protein
MTIYEFNRLDDSKKGKALITFGAEVAQRVVMGLRIALYQIGSFYTEVYFNENFKVVQGFRSFADTNELQPYLAAIDLSELLADVDRY